MRASSKLTANDRTSALKRLGTSSSMNNPNRYQLIRSTSSSISDARELLNKRNKTSFDARQLLTRPSLKTFDTGPRATSAQQNLFLQNKEQMSDQMGKFVVVTGLKDMKMKDGRVYKIIE